MSNNINLDKLTYNQKVVIDRFGYYLSPEEADKVKEMIGNLKDDQARKYSKKHGKQIGDEGKVLETEQAKSEEQELANLSTDDLLRELILTTRDTNKSIVSKLDEQTKKLGNISTAATLFIILSIIGILVSFCSSAGI